MKTLQITIFLLSISFLSNAQADTSSYSNYKNSILVNAGYLVWVTGSIYYERDIKDRMWNRSIKSFARVGGVYGFALQPADAYITAQCGMLLGSNHMFEVAAGFNFLTNTYYWGSANIGYRYQDDFELLPLNYRVGVAFPEGAYLGAGISF